MSKLIHIKSNDSKSSPHINNYSTRGIIHDTRKISNDPTCGRVKKSILITLLAVMGSCPLSCGILSTANNSAHAVGSEVHFGVNVPDVPVLEIILKDGNDEVIEGGTEMDVTPTMAYAGFNTADVNVTVGTSSNAGYNLKMLVDNSSVVSQNNLSGINSNALVSAEGNTIETLGENPETPFTCSAATATTCNFTVNSWGYRLSTDAENTYKAVPQAETELLNYTDGATNGVTTSLGFGVRANAKQAGGYYETTLNFIATANPEEITIDSIRYMQDFAALTATEYANVVSSMDTSKTYTLYDSRDRETYTVQKLADGRIWMLDNLRLGSNEPTLLTKANTNITDDYYVLPASVAEGFTDDTSGRIVARINTDSKNVELEYADGKSNKVGTYYNYCAVSAGEICEDTYFSAVNATTDICPKGWRLPTGGSSGEFRSLANNLGNVTSGDLTGDAYTTFKTAFHASLPGRFNDSSANNQGSDGYWWSSTYGNSTDMYTLYLNTSTVGPQNSSNRRFGRSVRCVLKGFPTNVTFNPNGATSGSATSLVLGAGFDTLPSADSTSLGFAKNGYIMLSWNTEADGSGTSYPVNTTVTAAMNGLTLYAQWALPMQNISSATLAALLPNNGDTTTLVDNRDGEVYTIGKLNDKYWMLDNLRLGGSSAMTLTGENTNLATTSTTYTLPASGTVCFSSIGNCTGTDGTTTGNGFTVAAINADYKNATHKKDDSSATFTYNSNGDVSKAGVYYNYCAASAGTICDALDRNNAQYDICPKGWRLPTGGSNADTSEFRALANNLGNVTSGDLTGDAYTNFKAAFHAGLSGTFNNGSVQNQTRGVNFWSSTRDAADYRMCSLSLGTTTVNPHGSGVRILGYPVRCVMK